MKHFFSTVTALPGRIALLLIGAVLLAACDDGNGIRANATIRGFSPFDSSAYLTLFEGAEPRCPSFGLAKANLVPRVRTIFLLLDSLPVEAYFPGLFLEVEGVAGTSEGDPTWLKAEVSVTAITATRVSGKVRILDTNGVPLGTLRSFEALRCPDLYAGD